VIDLLLKKMLIADFKIALKLKKVGVDLPGLSSYAVCSPFRVG